MGVAEVRARFADELVERLGLRTPGLRDAFARVPREDFHERGPWLLFGPDGYTSTPSADPACLYADVSVALDASRFINNSAPALVAVMIDALDLAPGQRVVHVGCGSGYYSAILAELVGTDGRVLAMELEPGLAERARRSLRRRGNVVVEHADGLDPTERDVDAILVSGGVTHPRAAWLDALGPGGRLVCPLTGVRPPRMTARVIRDHAGRVVRIAREEPGWSARFIETVAVPPLFGGRDPAAQARLARALEGGGSPAVRSLRRDAHAHDSSCWLVGDDFCLSTREPGG